MNNYNNIQFIKTTTPGPYDVPLKIVKDKPEGISFEIEIDDAIHIFEVNKKEIISSFPSENLDTLLLEISTAAMSTLYSKICAVMKSEENKFML